MLSKAAQRQRWKRFAPLLLLIGTYLLSAVWACSSPVPYGDSALGWFNFHPDESSHVAVIQYIAQHDALPPYRRPFDTSVHPPLYHLLCAVVYGITAPAIGAANALLLLRLLTAGCGVGTVYLVYRAARWVAPASTALLAALLVALVPMRASLGGSITNENLAALAAAGALATIVAALAQRNGNGLTPGRQALLIFWVIVGVGSKVTCLGLLLAAALAFYQAARREGGASRRAISRAAGQTAMMCGAVGLAWGWWFWRNVRLYGDPLRRAAAERLWARVQPGYSVIGPRWHLSAPRYAAMLGATGWKSFWGYFDGFSRPLPGPVYVLLLLLQGAAALGLARWLLPARRGRSALNPRARAFRAAGPIALFSLWVGAVFLQYNWSHYTPQGRYFFVLLLPFGILTAAGWHAALPIKARRAADTALIGTLAALNLYVLYVVPRRLPLFGAIRQRPPIRGTL